MPEEVKKSLIGDLAGLSEPLKKLLEVVSSGVGRLTGSMWLDKRDADNEAYRILKVGSAQTQVAVDRMKAVAAIGSGSTPQVQKLTLAGNEVNAELSDGQQAILALKERSDNRAEYQNLLHQLNTEQIVHFAFEELAQEDTKVSKEPVDLNWSSRYFDTVENISGEELQLLWGKVLAGEIKQPGSFSLRTLDVLKNLSQQEANIFESVCDFLIVSKYGPSGKIYTLVRAIGTEGLGVDRILDYNQTALMSDCGLIYIERNSSFVISPADFNGKLETAYQIGNKALVVKGDFTASQGEIRIKSYFLTKAGQEISALVNRVDTQQTFLKTLGKVFFDKGLSVSCADFIAWKDGGIVIENRKNLEDYE